ncbi:hypothetical protein [Mesorhizobium sangaii]|uniref:Uncharacterized protein n=1 Tax=Mesorhizobium sangaii TaxID=505389 RepID=A0A841PXZ4_9HYPH|nr:hypothetical protein [Mesorhizobium sangaii]MBB6413535.1 hypothetical protein [Mesorhizobium sangaii]
MTSKLRLSKIARDPIVAAFLERCERDQCTQPAILAPRSPVLTDGATEKVRETVDA